MYDAKWYKNLWQLVNNTFSSRHTMLRKLWLHYEKLQLLKADTTNYMKQHLPSSANTLSASQQTVCLLWNYLFTVVQVRAYYQNLTQIILIHSHTQVMDAYSSTILVPVYKNLLHPTFYICCPLVFKITFLPFRLFNYNSAYISPSICLQAQLLFIWITPTFGDKYEY
jgi:hypothetical protein